MMDEPYFRVDKHPPPTDGTWFLLRGRNSANQPMIPVVVSWCQGLSGSEDLAFRDSAHLSDMSRLIFDVPSGSSADWRPLKTIVERYRLSDGSKV